MERLDLHYDSLVSWFISHGKLENDCRKRLIGIESETKQLIDEIKSVSPGVADYVNKYYDRDAVSYYYFSKIIEILEKDERAKQKNFLGQCTFEPLYNSRKLLNKYTKNKLHLVAYSEILKRNIKYRIPFLKSSIKSSQKQIDNLLKKQAELSDQVDNLYKKLKERFSKYKLNIDNFTSQSSKDNLFDTININSIDLANEYLSQTFSEIFLLIKNDIFPITQLFRNVVEKRNLESSLAEFIHLTQLALSEISIDSYFDNSSQANKNLLLCEINQLLTFITQLKSQYEMAALPQGILNDAKFDNYIYLINKSIELINGRNTIEMIQIKYNADYRKRCASKEIESWNKYFNIRDLCEKTGKQIKQAGEEVQQLNSQLKQVRDETVEIAKIVELAAQQMTGLAVKIIGINM